MTMPLRSAPPPPTQAQARQRTTFAGNDDWEGQRNHSNYSQTKYEERKVPPPRPPPPKIGNNTTSKSSSSNVFSNLFGKSKLNTNSTTKNSPASYSSSHLFSLPPPPGAKSNAFVNHLPAGQQQKPSESLVELISFDSPPSTPTPSRSGITQMGPPLAGLDLLDSDPPPFAGGGFGFTSSSTTVTKSSGFEDSFVAWDTSDPFSPLPAQMPTFEQRATPNTTSVTSAPRSDFLDPLCNGKSLLAPQPVINMPTIIKPTKSAANVRATPKANVSSLSSGYGSSSVSEATISSSSSLSSTMSYHAHEESYGVVLYDFDSMQDGDLSLRANEKVYLLRQINDDWYYGRKKSGQEGMFPASYVDVKVALPPADEPAVPSPTPSAQSMTTTTTPTKRARVAFEFVAQTNDDLTLRENDIVTVLYAINDDWWFGELGQRRGQFPAAFVDMI